MTGTFYSLVSTLAVQFFFNLENHLITVLFSSSLSLSKYMFHLFILFLFFRSFTNLNNEQENETIDCPQSCDEQISMESSTSTPTETLPSQSSTTAPKPSPCAQYWTTTLRGKRTNTRVKIAENLEQRATDRNAMMNALLAEDAEDDIDLFFKSMAKSVKKLTPALQRRAKLETLNLITKLETEIWHPSSGNSCESNSYCSGTPNILSPTILSPSSEVDSSQNGSILVITQSPETFHQYESL